MPQTPRLPVSHRAPAVFTQLSGEQVRLLDVVRDRREVYPSTEAAAALLFSSPPSLPRTFEAIVLRRAEAVRRQPERAAAEGR